MLQKNSDRTRSLIYVCIVVYSSVFIYVLNVFVYPVKQYRVDDLRSVMACMYKNYDISDNRCTTLLKHAGLGPFEKSRSLTDRPYNDELSTKRNLMLSDLGEAARMMMPEIKYDQQEWYTIQHEDLIHKLASIHDKSAKIIDFTFPILGFKTDRNWIWFIMPLIGVLTYYLVWFAIVSTVTTFEFLSNDSKNLENKQEKALRLRLLLSTQMLTAPLNKSSNEVSRFHADCWKILAITIFSTPIIIDLIIIADQLHLIEFVRGDFGKCSINQIGKEIRYDFTQYHPLLLSGRIIFEIAVVVFQFSLMRQMAILLNRFSGLLASASDATAAADAAYQTSK